MKRIIRLTENDLARIVRRVIKENEEDWIASSEEMDVESDYSKVELEKMVLSQAEDATNSLSEEEMEILNDFLSTVDAEDFLELVEDEIKNLGMGSITEDEKEDLGMSDEEYQVRAIIDKVIRGTSGIAALGILPAAMFIGGGVAVALGVTAMATMLLKDVAWWRPKGYDKYKSSAYHRAADKARREGGNY
jgi:hypothetical protein